MPSTARLRAMLLAGVVLTFPTLSSAQITPPAPGVTDGVEADGAVVGDIVVTARRREERLQDVPVSISAFTPEALDRATVQSLADLRTLTPGFVFASEGGKDNTSLSLRGISQLPLGEATPGVVTYINDVPLPSVGSNVPTYDLSSIQVLKGPQGTLFGRNTLGGAVLVGTRRPDYDFGGYVEATYGRFDYRVVEGALNVPIIADKVALRIAGQIRRQDPRTVNFQGGPGFDDINQDGFRVSLLLEPFEGLRSTTIFEYFDAKERAGGLHLLRRNGSFIDLFSPSLGPALGGLFGGSLDAQVDGYLAVQRANFYGAFDDGINGGRANRHSESIVNDTAFTFGALTLRNIFGYRTNRSDQFINTGATGPLFFPTRALGLPADTPFVIQHAAALTQRKYITNELQLLGEVGIVDFIVGGFFNNDKPNGPSGSTFQFFATPADPIPSITSHVENKNYAVFGQVGIKVTEQLKINLGGRYSWDRTNACGGFFPTGYVTFDECKARAALNLIDGVGIIESEGEEPSWTIGLDYKPNDDLLLYAVTRRGYRGANVNTPFFESPFTTGAATGCFLGRCPDLRNFQRTGEERLTDVELGAKFDYRLGGGRGRFNLAGYRSKWKNALQFLFVQGLGIPQNAPDTPTNGSIAANVADITIFGIEAEASVSPSPNFSFSFVGAYTNQKVDKLTIPAGLSYTAEQVNLPSPDFSGTVSASWTLPFRPLDGTVALNADLFLTSDFSGQGGEKLPGYELANARIDWNGIGGTGLDIGVYVRNLFDVQYFAAPSVLLKIFPVSSVYTGEPRTYGVRGRFRF